MAQQIKIQKKNYPKLTRQYFGFALLILLAVGFYSFTQYQKLATAQAALKQGQETSLSLQTQKSTIAKQYADLKVDYDQKFASVFSDLEKVYPIEENYTDLARDLDTFFQENNLTSNPIFVSDLKFGLPRSDSGKEYMVLPVSMTMVGTQDNFTKFLKFVENSGVLEDKSRLMDIRSISINFTSAQQSSTALTSPLDTVNTLNVSVTLNAYFQKVAKAAATTAAPSSVTPIVTTTK